MLTDQLFVCGKL